MLKSQKTTWLTKKQADDQRKWFVVDLEGQILGRVATKIASVLRGKTKPQFTPNADAGDFVVVVNASKVKLTGQKNKDKMYRHHTEYIGGLKEISAEKLLVKDPEEVIRRAVWGMLPKTKLSKRQLKKLKVFAGAEHSHEAQQPQTLAV